MNNLGSIDLNLLVTLQALLAEKHISRAAVRLHKSQPAVSHALAHLRRLFDDPLLIRHGGQLRLSQKASELVQPLNQVLGQLGLLFEPIQFDPTQARRTFRLAMSDYGASVLLPGLVRLLRERAPNVALQVEQASRESMLIGVNESELDLAFGVFPKLPETLRAQTLFTEQFMCMADAKTLPAAGPLAMADWLARPHVLVAMRGGADNEVDATLSRLGVERQVSVTLAHWGVAAELIAGTDQILTIARRSLERMGEHPRLRVFPPPFALADFRFDMAWQQQRTTDPAHAWLRAMVIETLHAPL